MKKYLQIAILIMVSFTIGFSQDNGTNQERLKKYWYLRWRLVNYFMVMGDCYGCSLPAGIRNSYSSPQFIDGEQYWSKGMDFGDAPNYLGTYIGILATEYELLNDNDESTSATLNELHYAIKAINRLDECEAQYPWNKGANNLDGMCSRGDIDTGFVRSHYSELNQGLTFVNNQALFQGNLPQPGDPSMDVRVGSHYSYEKDPLIDKFDGMMSQDHISSILVGLALVKKFVPDNITINGMNLHDEAQHITERLIDYLQSHNWLLKNPDGDQIILDWGGQAILFSYGFAKAASFIWPQKTLDFVDAISLSNKPIWDGVGTAFLGATDFANWTGICDLFNEPDNCDNSGNAWIILNLAAVGNSWETVALEASTVAAFVSGNPGFAPLGAACFIPGIDCSQGVIWAHSKIYGWEAYYPLLHATLHNSGCLTSRSRIEEDLNSMPCGGHWGDNGPWGWSIQNKYHQIPSIQNTGNSGFAGQYSALEFMLLHNLYYLHGNNKDSDGNTLPGYNKMNITSVSQINCEPAPPPPPNCTVSLEQPDKVYNVSQNITGTEEKHFKNSITTQNGYAWRNHTQGAAQTICIPCV